MSGSREYAVHKLIVASRRLPDALGEGEAGKGPLAGRQRSSRPCCKLGRASLWRRIQEHGIASVVAGRACGLASPDADDGKEALAGRPLA